LHVYRDGLLTITARRRATDRKRMAQESLQSSHNVVACVCPARTSVAVCSSQSSWRR
jgi:hypothetical protein